MQEGGGAGGEAGAGVSTTKQPRQDERPSRGLPSEAIGFLRGQTRGFRLSKMPVGGPHSRALFLMDP